MINDKDFSYENIIETMVENIIFTKIKIGEPKQEIVALINSEEYSYFIYKDICQLDSNYDENKSRTYKPNNDYQFFYNGYGKSIYINESFSFEDKEIKNFPIMFMKDPKNDEFFNKRYSINDVTEKSCATIGLRFIKNYNDKVSKNFISVLNDLDIIDDLIIFIEYDENGNEKFLLIGEYPEMLYKNQYIFKKGSSVNIKIYNRFKPQWGFQCDKILSGNIKLEKNDITLHHNLGVIYAPYEYKEIIEKTFFAKYINLKICKKINNGEYIIFFCEKKKFENEINKFPSLKFIKNEFNEEFILTYKDLFFTNVENTYFLIVFHHLYNEIWELGKTFLRKFLFAYNFDSKIIIHYNRTKKITLEKNEYKGTKLYFKYIIFLSIFVCILFFLLGKRIYNKRKNLLLAKELEKNFSYNNKENKGKLIDD